MTNAQRLAAYLKAMTGLTFTEAQIKAALKERLNE